MLFGDRLKKLRLNEGITQKELGQIIGVSDRVIGYYESNDRFPKDEETLKRISMYFNVSIDYLIGTNYTNNDSDDNKIDIKIESIIKNIEENDNLFYKEKPLNTDTKEIIVKMLKTTQEVAEKVHNAK